MNVDKHARMTVHGRLLLVRRVREAGWRVPDAAMAAGVSERTAHRCGIGRAARALHDRSSAPARSPHRLPAATIAAIERLRRQRWTGPRSARALGRPVSTVGTTLRRLGLGRLSALDAKPSAVRYQRRAAGELLHIDRKKLGRIGGLGHRVTGDRRHRARRLGWEHLHVAIDDATRLAYTGLLPDERGPSCAGFLARAAAWFAGRGVLHRAGHDRQRLRLHPLPPVQGHPRRAWCSSPDHAALLPAHQRHEAPMKTVGTFEAKTHLSALLERVERGEEITITRHGNAVACLVPAGAVGRDRLQDTVKRLKAFRRGRRRGDLSAKELIEEGRQ
jgi:prevent-host-death family protein